MKINFHPYLIIIIAFYLTACSTGKSAYKKGDYYDATLKAVKNLRTNPDSKKSKELIRKSYPMAIDYNNQLVNQFSVSNSPDKYLSIVEAYYRLNTLADEITRCPAALDVVKPVVYFHKQLQKAEVLACDEQFGIASNLLKSGNYFEARQAIPKLQWVKNVKPGYQGIDAQLNKAQQLAILKIVVELKPDLNHNFAFNSEVFYQRLFDFLMKNASEQYTSFYYPEQAQDLKIVPHEILTVQFVEFQIGQMYEREKEKTYESDSLVVGTYTDGKGVEHNVFGTVKAVVKTFESEMRARAIVEIAASDYETGEIFYTKKYPNEYIWGNQWAIFNGDARAVPKSILSLTKEKPRNPPSPQEMFLLVSDPMFYNVSSNLKSYYKRK